MFVHVLYMDLRMCVVCTYIYFCMCISVRLCRVGMCLYLFVRTCICMCVCYVGMCSCVHILVYMEAFGLKPGGRGIMLPWKEHGGRAGETGQTEDESEISTNKSMQVGPW